MSAISLVPLTESLLEGAAQLLRSYPYKQFQHHLQGTRPEELAGYHVENLRRKLARNVCLWVVSRDGEAIGLLGLAHHKWHSEIFGHNIWVASPFLFRYGTAGEISDALRLLAHEASARDAALLSGRVDVEDYALLQGAGQAGWVNVGTSVKLTWLSAWVDDNWRSLYTTAQFHSAEVVEVDRLSADEADVVAQIAGQSHTHSHYFNDPRLDRERACRLFQEWAVKCAALSNATTFTARDGTACVGFLTALTNRELAAWSGGAAGVIDFIAVAPSAQKRGIGGLLLRAALNTLALRVQRIEVRTMLDNYAAIRLYQRHAAVLSSADVHLHCWLVTRQQDTRSTEGSQP